MSGWLTRFCEAGKAWNDPGYTKLGTALEHRIAAEEVIQVPGLGTIVEPGPTGFQHGDSYRLNASYVPPQLISGSVICSPTPWENVAMAVPTLVSDSAPHGFVSDWTDFKAGAESQASPTIGSYDAIRVYLWIGMLDKATPHRDEMLKLLSGMTSYLRTNAVRPPQSARTEASKIRRGRGVFSGIPASGF